MKKTRGISKEFTDAFKACELYELYNENKDELIVGVRNNYLSIYHNCDCIAKVEYKNKKIICSLDRYYIDGISRGSKDKDKTFKTNSEYIKENYSSIKEKSKDKATTNEKKAQAELYIKNNNNLNSNWCCIDIEYVKAFNNIEEKKAANLNARFDIIAISKSKPHKVALIELKYGSGAISGASGIYKHVKDFSKFIEKDFFEQHMKDELIDIVKSQKDLGIEIPFELPSSNDFSKPEFYFITLDNNAKSTNGTTPKQTMAGYLFKEKRWGCKKLSTKYCVEKDFEDITKKSSRFNASFLFSDNTLDNITIDDIIDGNYDEKVLPE